MKLIQIKQFKFKKAMEDYHLHRRGRRLARHRSEFCKVMEKQWTSMKGLKVRGC
ncbi:T4O12.6 [Arabidopsis thaliana]|uniref:T4O12.6 n=1 Tax=Arabidopsis thaliana TaxID=3702 RepID=Q9LQT1_ARATH|nr:T4O12.6 [Arabidopsis thaliana]